MKTCRIVIFAKAPRAGHAKTRLISALGAEGAAWLATRMLDHTVEQALLSNIGPVELCMTPEDDPLWEQMPLPAQLLRSGQGEGGLGERMGRVSQRVVEAGESIILIGTDCPKLDALCLQRMAAALAHSDAVMVSTVDGGYAALGMNRFDPFVFSDIEWGADSVAYQTLMRTGRLGWSVHMMPMLRDIDEAPDLAFLPAGWRESLPAR